MRSVIPTVRKNGIVAHGMKLIMIILASVAFGFLTPIDACHGIATQSSISISFTTGILSLNLLPSPGGTFGKSADSPVTISTDNFTGYVFSVSTPTSTSLTGSNGGTIPTINTAIDETTFTTSSTYVNQWGFKPSQYVTTSGNTDTVVQNSNFLPAPSSEGMIIAKTSSANATGTSNTYNLAFGAKVDSTLPAGTYTTTYVLTVLANSIVYNVTYDDNTSDTVTNMPLPNPQTASIDGGTPVAESYMTLSDAVPVRNEKRFAGWCDVATGVDSGTGDDTCSGNLYQAGDDLPIDQTAAPNITLYAVWVETLFPIVWNQMGACEFHGATNGNITGSECTDYHNVRFIDTGVALYSQANYQKDYEVHFTIDHYDATEQVNYYGSEDNSQQSFFNDKLGSGAGDGKAPGITIRRNGDTMIQINSKYNNSQAPYTFSYANVQDVSVFRLDGKIYYSIDNGPLILLQDITSFNQQFDLTAWFGAYPRDDCDGSQGPCTNVKRIPEATLSNMYIRLGEYSDEDIHTINFRTNDGTSTVAATYLVKDGNSITTLPADPTYTDHLFQGWFTAQSGGSAVTTSTVPDSSTSYWAHWLGTVALANITNTQISLNPQETETVAVTNSADIEPYTFVSNNTNIATVNANTGEITAVTAGTATITMIGTTSGETRDITVTVTGQTFTVYFDSQGGSGVNPVTVGNGGTIDPLPTSIKANSMLEGWYTGTNGTGTKLTTSTVFNSNTPTQYYANWEELVYVCKIATTRHSENCQQASGYGCRKAGWSDSALIEYGYLIQDDSPVTHGAAYDCDVNYDGVYDDETERFYYFGTENGNAKLVHYINLNNNASVGYDVAISYLPNYELDQQNPSTPVWDNPYLIRHTSGVYAGKAARFMSYTEISNGLWSGGSGKIKPSDSQSVYLFENTNFATANTTDGVWLEKSANNGKNRIQTSSLTLTHDGNTSANAARATIDVPVQYLEPYTEPVIAYTITFNPHNETSPWSETIDVGDDLTDVYPATNPTYTNHLFQGWYTSESGGTLITSATVPSGDTTYHAQWLKTVVLAEIPGNSVMVEAGYSATINVTNSSELEPYTFTSNDTSVATVNSATGQVTGVANGSTTITMTGTTSGATKTINVTVTDLLPVTQAIIANNDLTVAEGGQITIIVSNSSELEPYTFSSDDTSIATVDSSTGVITGVGAGTTNIVMTGANSGLTKTLEVEVTPAPVIMRTVTFDPNGGSFSNQEDATKSVENGTAVGGLPTPTKTNNMFFGWYDDNGTFYHEVYPTTVVDSDITYYAFWVENNSSFPILFAEINACEFHGSTANVSGDYCLKDEVSNTSINKNRKYIDSGVALYNTTNYDTDYEIGFLIVEYDFDSVRQMTFMGDKWENGSNWPGLSVRRYDETDYLEFTHSMNGNKQTHHSVDASTVHRVKVVRESGVIKYSINGGSLTTLQNLNNLTAQTFDFTVWFGASANGSGYAQRQTIGTLSDMYVKLKASTDYVMTFDANGGTASENSRSVPVGTQIGTLPTMTANKPGNYTFAGWYNEAGNLIDATYEPTSNETITAHWTYTSSDTPVVFDVSNDATRAYKTLINSWAQGSADISTFNKQSPINNSTWGDTSVLSEAQFWSGLKSNFETFDCKVTSYGDSQTSTPNPTAWTSGAVDCAKPDEYNTLIDAPLDVYIYDTVNETTVGSPVTYAEASDGILRNLIPGETYKWVKNGDSSVYGYVTVTSNGSSTGTRWVDAGVIRNARDLGGLPVTYTDSNSQTVTGTLAYGRLFRGERLWENTPTTELTKLGITKEYDVGNPSEYSGGGDTTLSNYRNDQVIHYDFDYHTGDEDTTNGLTNYMRAWLAVTHIMEDITSSNNPQNIYIHCRVGADRTGTVAYLLEGLLGVPDEIRYEEYELTHLSGLYDRTRYYKKKNSNTTKFVYMLDYVESNADILAWYMSNPNASMSLVQDFRAAMTVPTSNQQQNSPQNIQQQNLSPVNNLEIETEQPTLEPVTSSSKSSSNNYASPLGVSEGTTGTTGDAEPYSESSPLDGALVAAAAVITATGVSYVLAKNLNDDKEEQ